MIWKEKIKINSGAVKHGNGLHIIGGAAGCGKLPD